MGCDVEFFAFRAEPDLDKLRQTKWLTGWRLFKQIDADAWYLEGPAHSEAITFFEQLKTDKLPRTKAVDALASAIDARIKAEGGDTNLFYDDRFRECAALSKRLGQAVAHVSGNDEGLDGFAAFDCGEILSASCDIGWGKCVRVAPDGTVSLDQYHPEGTNDARINPRMDFRNAVEGLANFFGADDWLVSSDPHDFDADKYQLLAGQGEAPPIYKPFSRQLWDQLGPELDLGKVFAALDPYVEQVLAPDLSDADKDRRFAADEYPSGFLVYLGNLRQEPKWYQARLYASLRSLLSDMSAYTRALRPKPEFRPSSFKAESTRRALQRRWQALKLQARIFS